MSRRIAQVALASIIVALLAACDLNPAPVPPTLEPVQPLATSAAAQPTQPAAPTATPVPLGQGTAAPVVVGTPAAYLPLAAVPTGICLGDVPGGVRLPGQRFGVNIVLGSAPTAQLLDWAKGINAGWVRATLRWGDMEPQQGTYRWDSLDELTAAARERDLRLLLIVTGAPTWANPIGGLPEDPATFATFVGALAQHAEGQVSAYEIWDAPNTAAANGGTVVDPGDYAAFLKASYDAIKAADRCAIVMNGALLPNASRDPNVAIDDLAFYRGMLQYQDGLARDAYDIFATQLNTSGVSPITLWEFGNQALSRGYYNHVTLLRDEMTANGAGNKHLWITSIGYQTTGPQAVAPEQQSEYLVEVFERSRMFYPWISGIFVRALGSESPDQSYSLVNPDGSPRPAYSRLAAYFTERRAASQQDVTFPGTGLALLWEQSFPAARTFVLGPDGAVYGGTRDGAINARDPNGAFRRYEQISNKEIQGIAFDRQGNLYASTSDGALISSTGGGAFRWSAIIEGGAATPLLVSADGQTLYTGTAAERLDAYGAANGQRIWSTPLDGGIPGAPALGPDGTVYVGTTEGGLFAVAPDGSLRWQQNLGGWARTTPIVAGGNLYIGTNAGSVLALGRDGSQQWRADLGQQVQGLALAGDGSLYASTMDAALHAFSPDGTPRWSANLGGARPTAPVVGPDGTVYLGAEDGRFHAVSPDGQQVHTFEFGDTIFVAPLVSPDGAVYLSLAETQNDQDYLVAFGPHALKERYAALP